MVSVSCYPKVFIFWPVPYSVPFRLARFYADSQELLLNEPELQQLGQLWEELSVMANFMDILRNQPDRVAGKNTDMQALSPTHTNTHTHMLMCIMLRIPTLCKYFTYTRTLIYTLVV